MSVLADDMFILFYMICGKAVTKNIYFPKFLLGISLRVYISVWFFSLYVEAKQRVSSLQGAKQP